MLLLVVLVFVYWGLWVFALPFLDELWALLLFPPQQWAVKVPVLLLVLGTTAVGLFVGIVFVKAANDAEAEAQEKIEEKTEKIL